MADEMKPPRASAPPTATAPEAHLQGRPWTIVAGVLLITGGLLASVAFGWAALDRWPTTDTRGVLVRAVLMSALVIVPIFRPTWGVCLVFLAIPFFGNRPGGRYMELFNVLLAASLVGLAVHALRRRLALPRGPIWVLSWACALSAWVALVPATPRVLSRWLEIYDLPLAVIQTFTTRESDPLYSISSACLVALAVGWATALHWTRTDGLALNAARASTVALCATMVVGILDFHRIIDLESGYLLALDPRSVDNPGSLKSIFWNSSWFAWYFSMAFGVGLGLSVLESSRRRLALLAALGACYAYFLANPQRGGFIAVNAALGIVIASTLPRGPRRRVALLWGTAGALAVSVIVVAVVSHLPETAWFGGLRRLAASPTDEVREKLAVTALQMWKTSPVFGIGEGAFAWRYRNFVPAASPLDVPTHGDAHNTWLQILATRGTLGLSVYVGLWIALGAIVVRTIRRAPGSPALPFAAALGAFVVYSFVQGMFYLPSIQAFFWGSIALLPARPDSHGNPKPRRGWVLVACVPLVLGLSLWTQRHVVTRAMRVLETQPRGFYGIEVWPDGRRLRWSSKAGTLCLYPTESPTPVGFQAAHPEMSRRPVGVTVSHDGRVLDTFFIASDHPLRRLLPLPVSSRSVRDESIPFGECRAGAVRLTIRVDRVWSPSSFPHGDDPRHLGVLVWAPDAGTRPSR